MKCGNCGGKGFIEFEGGVIQVECEECEGLGEIDGDSGTGQPDSLARGGNPSESRKLQKSKVLKKARTRTKKIFQVA